MDLDLASNSTFTLEDTKSMVVQPLEILNAITAVISALANMLIIYIIIKFSIMRTRANVYLANWCICNFVVMILAPASLNLFGLSDFVPYELMCIWEECLYGILFGNLIFVVILLLDWYIMTYSRQNCSIRCRQSSKFIIAIVWIVITGLSVASITFCILNLSYPLTLVCFILGFLLIFIVIVLIFLLRFIKMKVSSVVVEKGNLELVLVSSFFLCWLPNWIALYGQIFLGMYFTMDFEHLTFFIGYSNAWILALLLYYFDKSFNLCLRKTFGFRVEASESNVRNKDANNTILI